MFDQQQHKLGNSPFSIITIMSRQDIVITKEDRSRFFDKIGELELVADNGGFTLRKLDVQKEYKYNTLLNYKTDELLIEWLMSYNLENNNVMFGFQ